MRLVRFSFTLLVQFILCAGRNVLCGLWRTLLGLYCVLIGGFNPRDFLFNPSSSTLEKCLRSALYPRTVSPCFISCLSILDGVFRSLIRPSLFYAILVSPVSLILSLCLFINFPDPRLYLKKASVYLNPDSRSTIMAYYRWKFKELAKSDKTKLMCNTKLP